jgi:hypothetical protein
MPLNRQRGDCACWLGILVPQARKGVQVAGERQVSHGHWGLLEQNRGLSVVAKSPFDGSPRVPEVRAFGGETQGPSEDATRGFEFVSVEEFTAESVESVGVVDRY